SGRNPCDGKASVLVHIEPSSVVIAGGELLGPGEGEVEAYRFLAPQPGFRKVQGVDPEGPTGLKSQGEGLPIPHGDRPIGLLVENVLQGKVAEGKAEGPDEAAPTKAALELDLAGSRLHHAIIDVHGPRIGIGIFDIGGDLFGIKETKLSQLTDAPDNILLAVLL